MSLIDRYEIKTTVRKRPRVPKKDKIVVKEQPQESAQWFQRLIDTHLICGVRRNDKLRIFIKLCELSSWGAAHPRSDLANTSKGTAGVSAIESSARWVVERNKILSDVRERYEREFLRFYTNYESDILRDVEHGFIDYGEARTVLNSALIDIVRAGDRRKPIIEVITSVCGIKAKGK